MKQKNLANRYGENSWAVITGGSDGIGLGIAHRLAMNKINVMLVARNEKKLQERVKEIKDLHNVKVDYRVADFGKGNSPKFYEDLYNSFEDLDISILVNNVGVGAKAFHEAENQSIWELGIINMVPEFMMTKIFLERLGNRSKRSSIIDISSIAATAEYANTGIYGATKAFNRAFNASMEETYGIDMGIDFLVIKPGFVLTKFGDGTKDGFSVQKLFKGKADRKMCFTTDECAEAIL